MSPGGTKLVRQVAVLVAVLPYIFSNTDAQAASATNSFNVKLAVNSACTLAVTNMNFGIVTTVTNQTATSNVTVNCTKSTFVQLSFTTTPAIGQPTKTAVMTNLAGNTIAYTMALAGWVGTIGGATYGVTTINGTLTATPGAPSGVYQDNETLYVIY